MKLQTAAPADLIVELLRRPLPERIHDQVLKVAQLLEVPSEVLELLKDSRARIAARDKEAARARDDRRP